MWWGVLVVLWCLVCVILWVAMVVWVLCLVCFLGGWVCVCLCVCLCGCGCVYVRLCFFVVGVRVCGGLGGGGWLLVWGLWASGWFGWGLGDEVGGLVGPRVG